MIIDLQKFIDSYLFLSLDLIFFLFISDFTIANKMSFGCVVQIASNIIISQFLDSNHIISKSNESDFCFAWPRYVREFYLPHEVKAKELSAKLPVLVNLMTNILFSIIYKYRMHNKC